MKVIVLGLPRGGVPVAFEVSKALRAPLDVFVVRKLGTPSARVAMGAIATGGVRVLNEEVVGGLGIPMEMIDAGDGEGNAGIETAPTGLPGNCSEPVVCGKTVILIDNGIATSGARILSRHRKSYRAKAL
jgi:putative phosphoribosyl transferase